MKITWLGHAGFRVEIADQVLLIDPWMTGNPVFPEGAREAAIAGATQILLTHGHGDHATDVVEISSETGESSSGDLDPSSLPRGGGREEGSSWNGVDRWSEVATQTLGSTSLELPN